MVGFFEGRFDGFFGGKNLEGGETGLEWRRGKGK
jgi:hypothetical protein